MDTKGFKFNSKAIHAGHIHDKSAGSHVTPIYQTSTFCFDNAEQGGKRFAGKEEGYIYTRLGNPNTTELAEKVAQLENGECGLITSSGMSAISTVLIGVLKKGDHILASDTLYGCTYTFISEMLPQYGIEVTFVDAEDLQNVQDNIKANTKIIYIETPANPTMKVIDIKKSAEIAHRAGALLVVDNTFMTPYLQRPLELGADLVVHSATKYIGGHGDVVAGIIVGSRKIITMIEPYLKNFGGTTSPFDAWLLMRGLKTLGIRMKTHCENALIVAEYLDKHPKIKKVYYPGLKSHPQYDLSQTQADGFGGMISFELNGTIESGITLMNSVQMITLAVSLGSVDSLIQHPASMTHAGIPREERIKSGIGDSLVRLSVGIENIEDILADLSQALDKI